MSGATRRGSFLERHPSVGEVRGIGLLQLQDGIQILDEVLAIADGYATGN
ncbi:MAG: hypothetical protein ACRDHG_03300 [Anaerolineales bacterium]